MHLLLNGLLTLAFQENAAISGASDTTAEAIENASNAASQATEAVSQAAETASQATGGSGWSGVLLLLGIMALVILPFVFGQLIANGLKVRDWGMRFGICLFALVMSVVPFAVTLLSGKPMNEIIRLGIDLKGGTNMVFQVKGEGKEITNSIMDRMVGAVNKRINPSGTEEITVRQVGVDRLEVIVPGEDPQTVDEIKRRIVKLGSLEFYIAASAQEDREIVEQALLMSKDKSELFGAANNIIAIWRPAYMEKGEPKLLTDAGLVTRTIEKIRDVDGKPEKYNTEEYLLLVDLPEAHVTGKYLTSASPGYGPNGQIIVNFTFNQRGGFLFQQLTSRNLPTPGQEKRKLAILLDGHVFTAPQINSVIADRGYIEGGANGFSQEDAQELSDVLNAGALEVPIDPKPLSEATIDPTLGADVRRKGVQAVLLGGATVIAFMLIYYRTAGIVAIISLVLNILLVMGTMVLINATFTLPGLAGIVLVIGMAVDANVLIYERIREETNRGSSLRMAIQNGFSKAFSTIIDSNVTTLLTAIVLFMIGTDTVKGFAVTLFIGIVMSMFTALYVGRLIFDLIEKKRWVTKLNMMSLVGQTNWDFLGKRQFCAVLSGIMIIVGLAAFSARGQKNYDIDFTGGTMVTFQLTEPGKTDDVRKTLANQFKDSFTLERLAMAEDTTEGIGRHFRLRTTETDSAENVESELSAEERVRDMVYEAFKANPELHLRMVTMEFSEIQKISVAEGDESAEAILLKRFDGGSSAEISFSGEVAAGTVVDMLSASIGRIRADGQVKYQDAAALIDLVGLEGSGMNAAERDVRKYNKLSVRTYPNLEAEDLQTALKDMQSVLATSPLFDEVNTFASAVASEMKNSAILAIVISMLVIVGYIWVRFQNLTFGLAAVAALVHDVIIVLGMLALVSWLNGTAIGNLLLLNDFRINLPMIAAFLTLVGYSLNDTIVVFDRIREVRGKNPLITIEMVNSSLNQTLSRTLLTSLTTWLVVIILYVMGGEGIHGFAFCLTVGIIVGTYSSIYVASPVLIWLMNRKARAVAKAA